jgi:hypothetical protein
MSKYHARKTVIGGRKFDSHAEAMRWRQLRLMLEAGVIANLFHHIKYCLQDGFRRDGKVILPIFYEADFVYNENGRQVVEDVKGVRTQVYALKRKMFLKRYPDVDFREVEA